MMKKTIHLLLTVLALMAVSCTPKPIQKNTSQMRLFVDGIGEITADTTITVHEVQQSLSGAQQMQIQGELKNVEPTVLTMQITRSATDRMDEFCTERVCTICDGEPVQELVFNVPEGEPDTDWYAHYTLPKEGEMNYTVQYKFINLDRHFTLTVHYEPAVPR